MSVKYDVSNIPLFYQSLMNTWALFSHHKVTPPSAVNGIPFEPVWYNRYVTHNSNIITDTFIQQFISLGITQVKHLCKMKSYEPQFRSKRIFESLKREITAAYLRQHWNDALHTSSRWRIDAVIKHVTDIEISCEKNQNLSTIEIHQRKDSIRLLLSVAFLMMILEYGVTYYILRLIEKYTSLTCMIVC